MVIRPSGTEPKLKCYMEVVVPVAGSVADARARADRALDAIRDDLAAIVRLTAPVSAGRAARGTGSRCAAGR